MRKRNNRIVLRLTEEELKSLNQRAKDSKYAREHYIRTILFKLEVPQPRPNEDYYKCLQELLRIGNNINQMAIVAHKNQQIEEFNLLKNEIEGIYNLRHLMLKDRTLPIPFSINLNQESE